MESCQRAQWMHVSMLDFANTIATSRTHSEAFKHFQNALNTIGFDHFVAFVALTLSPQNVPSGTPPYPVLELACPDQWQSHYLANHYYEIDPVLQVTPLRRSAFLWRELQEQLDFSPRQLEIFNDARDADLHNGVSVPIHGPGSEVFLISLATNHQDIDPLPFLGQLQMLATLFQIAYAYAAGDLSTMWSRPQLSKRELECLTWTARGKSAWAISVILDISEHTVNFHLKNAMRKLGTSNRVHAVVNAFRHGLISL